MKIRHVVFNSSVSLPMVGALGGGGSLKTLDLGMPCNVQWGGGVIAALEYDRSSNSLVIRKDKPFMSASGEKFDCVLVPWPHVNRSLGIDEPKAVKQEPVQPPAEPPTKDADPPPAKPIQQGQQRR